MEPPSRPQPSATEEGKIFVGGLSWETTKESLRAHFEQFGEVTDATIMMDPTTRKPRGFGFVQFADPASVNAVMDFSRKKGNEPVQHHVIDGKQVDPKPAVVKGGATDQVGKKVFVGGVGHDATEDDVIAYFSQYGTVNDVDLKGDKATSKKKGFAFVTFDKDESVDEVVKIHYHQLKGKTVECKKALPRNQTQKQQPQQTQQFYGGTAPYGGYGTTDGGWGSAAGYQMYPQQQQQHQQPYHQQQQPYAPHPGNYMRGGYGPQNQAGGGYHMGRGDMHNHSAPPTHQGHMTQGYGRGHDTTSYTSGPATGYGQAATAGGAAYGAAQTGYNYDGMAQVGTQPNANPYGATATYGDTTANAGYPVAGGGPQHKQQQKAYSNYY